MTDPLATRQGKSALVNDQGEVVLVDPKDVEDRLSRGYAPMSEQELAASEQQAQLSTPGAIAETALKSTLNTFAAPVVWAGNKLGVNLQDIGMSPDEAAAYHARERGLEEANPIAATGGKIAGALLGAKALGVTGAATRAEAALGGFRGALASNAIQGTAFGAIDAMADDPQASAEHVLASGGMGALLGAGTGALLHGAGRGLARVFASPESNALTREAAQIAEGSIANDAVVAAEKGRGAKLWDTITGKVSGAPKELLEEVGPTGTRRAEAIKAAEGFDRWADETALKMQKLSNEASTAVDDVTAHVRNAGLREEGIRKITDDAWNTVERRKFSRAAVQVVGNNLDDAIASMPSADLLPVSIKKQFELMQRQVEHTYERLAGTDAGTDAASSYVALAQMKTNLQKTVLKMRTAAGETQRLDPFEREAVLDAAGRVEKIQEELRQSLVNPKIWGEKVAGAYSEINAVWHEGAVDALNNYGHQFQRWTGQHDYETGRKVFESDPAKILSSLKSIGTANGAIAERTMVDYLHHTDRLIEKIGSKFDLDDAGKKAVDAARERFGALREMFESARDRTQLADKFKQLETYRSGGLLNLAPVLGGFAGHGPGAALGTVLGAAANPAAAARFAEGMSGTARKWVQSDILDSVSGWVRSTGESVARGTPRIGMPRGAATSAAVALFRGKHVDVQDAYQDRVGALLRADPGNLGEHVSDVSDATMLRAGAGASNAIAYLRESLPPYLQSTTLLRSTQKLPISQPDMTKFARVWGTVADPSTAIRDLKAGRFTPAQAQALQRVYPSIYDEIRSNVVESIGRADAEGKTIPIQVREQLSLLLNLDGAGEPALSSQFAARIQGLQQAQAKQQPQKRPQVGATSKSIKAARTPLQQATEI